MRKTSPLKTFGLALMASSTLLSLGACSGEPKMREQVAMRTASPAFMVRREIPAGPFSLTAWERAHTRNAPATVYIAGDGLNWLSRTQKSLDPTPVNPVALNLAAMDKAQNVFFLARPCQYSMLTDQTTPCSNEYWTSRKYAPETLDSMNDALDNIKRTYDITEFHLVGYSGGANVAALLAERRGDVKTLRTVAGNLNHKLHSELHQVFYLDHDSLNAYDIAPNLANLPQRHFIGGQDTIVPPAIPHSFAEAVGDDRCVETTFIQEAEHENGWADKWPELLALPVECKGPAMEIETITLEPAPKPFPRAVPDKP